MSPRILSITRAAFVLLFCVAANASAQTAERIGSTYKGPDLALIRSILKEGTNKTPDGSAKPRLESLKFNPTGDSGVAKTLADAMGRNPEEKAALTEAFMQIKQGYDEAVAKEGKSNNLAAAMTFFIAANVTAYHQTDMPSDETSESLFNALAEGMSGVPAFGQMSNLEKQQMHDWLVSMGGFVVAGYRDAKQSGDQESVKIFREFADYSTRLVLGVEVGKLSIKDNRLSMEGAEAAAPTAASAANKIAGVWSKAASSPLGPAGSQNLVTNAGYYKGEYQFKPDGTYGFKAERWYGYMRSREFYTTEESGTYSVSGDSLTISPRASKTTLRNPEGVVQKTQNNPLENVTYKWQLHYFEGLNETQLVLKPAQETTRDGGWSSSGPFPNAYLYGPGGRLQWKF